MKYTNEEKVLLDFKNEIETFLKHIDYQISRAADIEELLSNLEDMKSEIDYFIEDVENYMEENQEREEIIC